VRNSIACAILVASNACAPASVRPVAAAASLPADFTEIAPDRCSPALDGLFVSYDGANDLIRSYRRQDAACESRVIDADVKREIAEARCKECVAAKNWSIWGPVAGFMTGVAITLGIVLGVGALK